MFFGPPPIEAPREGHLSLSVYGGPHSHRPSALGTKRSVTACRHNPHDNCLCTGEAERRTVALVRQARCPRPRKMELQLQAIPCRYAASPPSQPAAQSGEAGPVTRYRPRLDAYA